MTNLGHNNPPELTHFERAGQEVETLLVEANNWLNGDPIENQGQADTVSDLLNQLRSAKKFAEKSRTEEKAPHLKAGKDVDAKYKPLSNKVVMAERSAKKALEPWLIKLDEEKRAKEEALRKESEENQKEAEKARLLAQEGSSLEDRENAEALTKQAEQSAKDAKKAANFKAQASGGDWRAVGLRDNWTATITDLREAVGFYWKNDRQEFESVVQFLANRDVKRGKREIPGIDIKNNRKVV